MLRWWKLNKGTLQTSIQTLNEQPTSSENKKSYWHGNFTTTTFAILSGGLLQYQLFIINGVESQGGVWAKKCTLLLNNTQIQEIICWFSKHIYNERERVGDEDAGREIIINLVSAGPLPNQRVQILCGNFTAAQDDLGEYSNPKDPFLISIPQFCLSSCPSFLPSFLHASQEDSVLLLWWYAMLWWRSDDERRICQGSLLYNVPLIMV